MLTTKGDVYNDAKYLLALLVWKFSCSSSNTYKSVPTCFLFRLEVLVHEVGLCSDMRQGECLRPLPCISDVAPCISDVECAP